MCKRKKKEILPDDANNTSSALRRPLSPMILKEGDQLYPCVEELEYVVEHTNCKNIAITGVYGSGKSSVIETFLSKQSFCKNPLKISLSTFVDEVNGNAKPVDLESYNSDIEYKIVQHILYKSDPKKLRQSRFDRIIYRTNNEKLKKVICILFAFIAFIVLFEPSFLRVESIYVFYGRLFGSKTGYWVNFVADVISALYLLYCLSYLIFNGLSRFFPFWINKFKANNIEVDFSKNSSVFNKLLDEIVYYFKANQFDLVIFEDLDRLYKSDSLFLKLRELNMLLNESETIKEDKFSVRFVYAIRDDVFTKELRTKCFDYIIPVSPVINHFNSSDYLIRHKSELFGEIEDNDIRELGIWISGYRELNNIINEFGLYKKLVLKGNMSEKKLLAIIIYKNLYPQDYSALHNKSGLLYTIFENKKLFTDRYTKANKEEIRTLKESVNRDKDNIVKVKGKYLDFIDSEYYIKTLFIGEEGYSLKEVLESERLFEIFKKDGFTKYYYVDSGNDEAGVLPYDIKFREIQDSVGDGLIYEEAISSFVSAISKNTETIDMLTRQVRNIEKESLSKIFEKADGEENKKIIRQIFKLIQVKKNEETANENNENLNEIDEDRVSILQAMIRGGYIVEDYPTYVSFYHSGSLLEGDFNFLNSVRQSVSKPFNTRLSNPELIVKQLVTNDFTKPCILNFDLLEYLLIGGKTHLLQKFVEPARENFEFIIEFSKIVDDSYKYKFLMLIFKGWYEPINTICSIQDEQIRTEMLVLYFFTSNTDVRLQNEEIDFINDSYLFINQNISRIDIKRLKQLCDRYNVKFHSLAPSIDTSQNALLEYVTTSSKFDITYDNLRVVFGKDYETQSFSAICKMQNNNSLWHYLVGKNISVTASTFPDTSIDEEPTAIVQLINQRDVGDEWLNKYISQQNIVLESVQGVVDSRQYIIFENDKVKATWNNILEFIKIRGSIDGVLDGFIKRHVDELKEIKCEGDSSLVEILKNYLFCNDNSLDSISYKLLLPCFEPPLNIVDARVGEEKIAELIKQKWIIYNDAPTYIKESFSIDVLSLFFIKYFDEFIEDDTIQWEYYNSNQLGIKILESELTLERKISFIDGYAKIDTSTDDSSHYAGLICKTYVEYGKMTEDTLRDLLVDALKHNMESDSWHIKISLINMMNSYFDYDKNIEKTMISALGGEMYPRLNTPYGSAHFDINNENMELLSFLKEHGHYVSNFHEKEGQIWVSFMSREPNV